MDKTKVRHTCKSVRRRPQYKGPTESTSSSTEMTKSWSLVKEESCLNDSKLKKVKNFDDETYRVAQRILDILREADRITYELLREVRSLIDSCPPGKQLSQVVDYKNFNMVQRAVLRNGYSILEHLIHRGFDLGLFQKKCSNPLHMACQLGHCDIVTLFLRGHVDPTIRSTTCILSGGHCDECKTPGPSMFVLKRSCCHIYSYTPIEMAILHDKDEILGIWLEHPLYSKYAATSNLFFLACQEMAHKCLGRMVCKMPSVALQLSSEGRNLLAVAAEKSEKCLEVLLSSGIRWRKDDFHTGCLGNSSVLHEYFRSYPLHPLHVVQLALTAGYEREFLNQQDRSGDTALMILLRQIGKHHNLLPGSAFAEAQMRDNPNQAQEDRQDETFESVKTLVKLGADLHMTNNIGESVLHVLLKNDCGRLLNNSYYCALAEVNRTLGFLLSEGANVNLHSSTVATPLMWAMHILCSMESSTVERVWPEMFYCFRLLLDYGANPNDQDEKGIGVLTFVLTVTHRWMNQCLNNIDQARCILRYLSEMLALFFQHGLQPSCEILDLCTKQIATLCNVNINNNHFFSGIKSLLVPFFQHGVDPNMLRMVNETSDQEDVPCQLDAQFYLARAFMLHRHHPGVFSFFSIFENTLEQDKLNHLLQNLAGILMGNFEDNEQQTSTCIAAIRQIGQNPRPLKKLCRITICKYLHWRIEQKVVCLPLPMMLRNYIMNI